MTRTDSIPDVQDLEAFFRGRVPGDADRWAALWGALAEKAEEARQYCANDNPDEWPIEVETFTRDLRRGMAAGRVVKPSGATRQLGEGVGSEELGAHQTARAMTLAEHAAAHPSVMEWRERRLPGGVRITDNEVRAWAAEHPGPVSVEWVTEDGHRKHVELSEEVGRPLVNLVRRLATAYRWEPGLAASFVLTGAVPHAPMLRVRTDVRHGGATGTASDLITLRVHPDVPAGEVEAAYRQAQAKEWGRRAHLIGDRTAEAVYRSTVTPGGPRSQNAAMTEPYGDASNFRRTVERAKQRLMGNPGPVTHQDFRRALLGARKPK